MSALNIPRAAEFVALLRARLSEGRVRHCVSVAETMWAIADDAGIDRERAVVAGLLHDMCKALGPAVMLAAAERYRIDINESQRKKPMLLHGHVAAAEAKHELGIAHDDVHEAIAWHVTGKPNIGPLALALYYADFSEPLRNFEEAAVSREIFKHRGLLRAVAYVATAKIERLVQRNALVDRQSHDFWQWLAALEG